jgi:hypothetical protein
MEAEIVAGKTFPELKDDVARAKQRVDELVSRLKVASVA